MIKVTVEHENGTETFEGLAFVGGLHNGEGVHGMVLGEFNIKRLREITASNLFLAFCSFLDVTPGAEKAFHEINNSMKIFMSQISAKLKETKGDLTKEQLDLAMESAIFITKMIKAFGD